MIEFICFQSQIGMLSIFAIKEGVIKISFSNKPVEEIKNWCRKYFRLEIINGTEYTSVAKYQILDYISGNRQVLDFPIVHINSPFRKKVLEAERNITFGQTRSYKDIAQIVNNPKAFRAVGSANAENPLPLYFPCHRIICSNGKIGEFGGGAKNKHFLLELESSLI